MTDVSRDGDVAAFGALGTGAPSEGPAAGDGTTASASAGAGPESPGDASRTVNLDLGNMAELNMVAINAAHIVSVRLSGTYNSGNRKMEVSLANGSVIGMGFDDPDHAEAVFGTVVASINRTIPDHRVREVIVAPQKPEP
jgi:hypothetical protein